MCKEDTRKSFDEFKRVLDVGYYPFNDVVKEDMQNTLTQDLCKRTVKHFVNTYRPSSIQIKYLTDTTDYYKELVLKVSDNYCKKHYDTLRV
jgi:hypothetical protein